mgnify:CR=1 FL=1
MILQKIFQFRPNFVLLLGMAFLLIYPASVALGRKTNPLTDPKLEPGWNITLSSQGKEIIKQFDSGIFLEANADFTQSQVRLLNLSNNFDIQTLLTIQHTLGYPPDIRLCLKKPALAATIIPPGSSEYAARFQGGEVWWVDLNTSLKTQIGFNAISPPYIAPGCDSVLYSRLVPLPQPDSSYIPFRTDLILADLKTNQERVIFSDSRHYGVTPLGWNTTGSVFFTLAITLQGGYYLHAIDVITSTIISSWNMVEFDSIRKIEISPIGDQLIFEGSENKENGLYLIPLPLKDVSHQPKPFPILKYSIHGIPPFKALWGTGGRELLIFTSPDRQNISQAFLWNSVSRVRERNIHPNPDNQWIPESLSRNAKWIAWREYQKDYPAFAVSAGDSGIWLRISPQDIRNYLSWVGWWER